MLVNIMLVTGFALFPFSTTSTIRVSIIHVEHIHVPRLVTETVFFKELKSDNSCHSFPYARTDADVLHNTHLIYAAASEFCFHKLPSKLNHFCR